MPILELTDAQVIELLKQLPPERKQAALVALTEGRGKRGKKRSGILRKDHPFLKLIGKGQDRATDVSRNKYRYVAAALEGKR